MRIRTLVIFLLALLFATDAAAQGTQLTPPGIKWGSGGVQVPAPILSLGYDNGIPCIVGSTATCSLQVTTSSSGGSVTANVQGFATSAAPTYTTSTYNPLSLNTTGDLRVTSGVSQGSSTSGQLGSLILGAVTTSAPSYSNAATNPLSLTATGDLRVTSGVTQGSATSGQNGALILGASTASPPSYVEGTTNPISTNLFGAIRVIPQAAVQGSALFTRVAAGQATTTIKSGAGTLYAIIFSGPATASNTTTVYDNTAASGTVIAVPLATAVVGPTSLSFGPVGLAFGTGLTVITQTANGADMTFVYK